MSRYDGKDVYCYDNSNVLINKLNITDEKELEEKERKISLLNTILLYEEVDIQKIKFDIKFYKQIHKTLFNDIYPFAGNFRNIVLSKGNSRFCEPQYIDLNIKRIFKELKSDNFLYNLKKEVFIEKIAYYYSELNAIHAYREGNGRTNRIFLDLLAKKNEHDLGIENWKTKEQLNAMIDSMKGDNKKLVNLLKKHLVK